MANKKGNSQALIVGGILLLAILVFYPGIIPQPATIAPPVPGSTPGSVDIAVDGTQVIVNNPVQFTETTNAYNVALPGTAVATPSITQWLDGYPQASQNTTPPYGAVELLLVDKSGWYGTTVDRDEVSQFQIPNLVSGIRAFDLAQEDASIDIIVVNSDGYTANVTSSAEEAIGTGGASNVELRIKGGTPATFFGNPVLATVQPNVLCADANATEFKMSSFTAQIGANVLDKVSAPASLTIGSTANQSQCWELPGTVGTQRIDVVMNIVAQTSVDPSANINLNLFDGDYFQDVYGSLKTGVNTDTSADVGATNETETIFVS